MDVERGQQWGAQCELTTTVEQWSLRCGVGLEPACLSRTQVRLVALRVCGRAPSLRGGECHLPAGVLEPVVGRGQLLQPNPVLRPVSPSWSCEVSTMRTFMCPSCHSGLPDRFQ